MRDLQGEENKMLLKDAFFYILWEILFLYNKFFLFIFYIINFCINQLIFWTCCIKFLYISHIYEHS